MAVKSSSFSPVIFPRTALVYADPLPIDASVAGAFGVVLAGATALVQNATNKVVGMRWDILVTQGPGAQELTWDTDYDFGAEGVPVMAALAAGRQALVSCEVLSATHVICSARMDFRAS